MAVSHRGRTSVGGAWCGRGQARRHERDARTQRRQATSVDRRRVGPALRGKFVPAEDAAQDREEGIRRVGDGHRAALRLLTAAAAQVRRRARRMDRPKQAHIVHAHVHGRPPARRRGSRHLWRVDEVAKRDPCHAVASLGEDPELSDNCRVHAQRARRCRQSSLQPIRGDDGDHAMMRRGKR